MVLDPWNSSSLEQLALKGLINNNDYLSASSQNSDISFEMGDSNFL